MSERFKRIIENFTCEHCGREVEGGGYTNHCPECLWSKHVDVFPGDRKESCLGLMKPVRIDYKGGEYSILHQCVRCGFERPQKLEKGDNFDALVKVVKGV